jgi:hypothetical protein
MAITITIKPKIAGLFFNNLVKAKAPGDLLLSNVVNFRVKLNHFNFIQKGIEKKDLSSFKNLTGKYCTLLSSFC